MLEGFSTEFHEHERLTPCIALESSMLALGSDCCSPAFSTVFLPTKRLFGSLGTGTNSSAMSKSVSGPRLVAARSSSMMCLYFRFERVAALWWDWCGGHAGHNFWWGLKFRAPLFLLRAFTPVGDTHKILSQSRKKVTIWLVGSYWLEYVSCKPGNKSSTTIIEILISAMKPVQTMSMSGIEDTAN